MNFIKDYLTYHAKQTDGSLRYAEVLAIAALGHAIGKRSVCLLRQRVYHNFYILLVGMSSKTRKSTSMGLLKVLIDEDDILPDYYSPEALYDSYEENPQRILFDGEISRLFKRAGRQTSFMSPIIEDFEFLYDCPSTHKARTRNRGREIVIKDVYLSIVGCITPEKVRDTIKRFMVSGGFFPRCLVVWERNPKVRQREQVESPGSGITTTDELKKFLNKLGAYSFDFVVSPTLPLQVWVEKQSNKKGEISSIVARYEAYIIKIADILALNEYLEEYWDGMDASSPVHSILVEIRHFREAQEMVKKMLRDAHELELSIGKHEFLIRLHQVISEHRRLSYKEFLVESGMLEDNFKSALNTLLASGLICGNAQEFCFRTNTENAEKHCPECEFNDVVVEVSSEESQPEEYYDGPTTEPERPVLEEYYDGPTVEPDDGRVLFEEDV